MINNVAVINHTQMKDPCKGCKHLGMTSYCCNIVWLEVPQHKNTGLICFDTIHFYLTRPNISAVMYAHKGAPTFALDHWEVILTERCEHLQKDGKCGIYERRPLLCAQYSALPTTKQKRPCARYDRSVYDQHTFNKPDDFMAFVKTHSGYDFVAEREKIKHSLDHRKIKVTK